MKNPLDDLLEYVSARADADGSDLGASEAASQKLLETNPPLFNVMLCIQNSDWALAREHLCEMLGRGSTQSSHQIYPPVFSFGASTREENAHRDSQPTPFFFRPLSFGSTELD